MRGFRLRWFPVVTAVGLAAMLAGCQDLLVYQNFSQIHENASTQAEVARIIGEPDQKLGNQWLYERPDKHLTALVDFDESGRVTRKQWIDAMSGVWEDSEPQPADRSSHQSISTESRRP